MAIYENPANGRKVTVGSLGPFFGSLFFGCFYFLIKGSGKEFLKSALIMIFTCGLAWLFYPFCAASIVRRIYEDKGFIPVSSRGAVSGNSGMKKCPHCAKYIKRDANVCRHCGNSLTSSRATSSSRKRIQIKQRSAPQAAPAFRAVPVEDVTIECPYCENQILVANAASGSRFECPHCQKTIQMQ